MILRARPDILRFFRQTKGSTAVEFAIIGSIFMLVIAGAFDFGHAFYMKQVITNASREGARYGITYQTDATGARIAPSALSPTIQSYIQTKYLTGGTLPSNANPSITPAGAGYASGAKGAPVQVTVSATKYWFLVSGFIPGLGKTKTITASTVMLCE